MGGKNIDKLIRAKQRDASDNRWSGSEDWAQDEFGQTIMAQRICALYVKKYGVSWNPLDKELNVVGRRQYEKDVAFLLARPDWPALVQEAIDNII